jgi:ankyrin repeat protein
MTLWEAAISGDSAALGEALDAAPSSINEPGPGGWPALHLAAHFGHADCVKLLLARGAGVEVRSVNEMHNLALHAGAAGRDAAKRAAILKLLLDGGTPVDATQAGGFTALHSACQNHDQAAIDLLLARGADPKKNASDGRTPESLAAGAA